MALPTVERTWQYNVNQIFPVLGSAIANYQALMYAIKAQLISFATFPWTVVGSSNSVTAGMDAVDRWLSPANLVWINSGASPHSWIVLKQTVLGSNFQLCIQCNTNVGGNLGAPAYIYVSQSAGFTGGTTGARPTATDELGLRAPAIWGPLNTATPFASVLHMLHSADGESTRFLMCHAGVVKAMAFFEKAADPVAPWTQPVFYFWHSDGGSSIPEYATFYTPTANVSWRFGGANEAMFFSGGEGVQSGGLGNVLPFANELTGVYPLIPVSLTSVTTVGKRGRHGRVKDLWWSANDASLITGSTYPNDTSRQFAQFGKLVVPWDGSVISVT